MLTNFPQKNQKSNKFVGFKGAASDLLRRVEVEANRHCNLKCHYCPNSNDPTSKLKIFMPHNLFTKILTDLKNMNFEGIFSYHFFGEPLLNPNLDELIKLTKKIIPNVETNLLTNGIKLTKDRLKRLLASGIDKIVISKHTRTNIFMKQLPNIPDEYLKNVFIKFPEEMVLSNRAGLLDIKPPSAISFQCHVPKETMVITHDGNILPCFDDFKRKNVMGNVIKQSLTEVWNSSQFVNFREEVGHKGNRSYAKTCANCTRQSEMNSIRRSAIDVKNELV